LDLLNLIPIKRFERQAQIWKSLNHPNIIPLLGIFYEFISVELVDKGPHPESMQKPLLACPWAFHGNAEEYLNKDLKNQEDTHLLVSESISSKLPSG
jgi:serine/threonine protein kinase